MVYTSSYFNIPAINNYVKVSISVSKPKGLPYAVGHWRTVAPDWPTILKPYKKGSIDDAEYTRRYLRQLNDSKTKIVDWYRDLTARYKNVVLLCWCKKGNFCHRRLLAEWLEKQGFDKIEEL